MRPEDFVVDEIPAYLPEGQGEHLFVHFRKTGLNTPDAVARIAKALGVDPRNAGWAGLKDRHAVTTQWASFQGASAADARQLELPSIEVLDARPHVHKLRTGHLRANRFHLVVRGEPGQADTARQILELLVQRGAPNYFGEQRFGHADDNLVRARAWLLEGGKPPRERFKRKLRVSTLQAAWFNDWLAKRVESSELGRAIDGDLLRKEDTGGLFTTADLAEAQARLDRWEVSPTGPIFGPKMRQPHCSGPPTICDGWISSTK